MTCLHTLFLSFHWFRGSSFVVCHWLDFWYIHVHCFLSYYPHSQNHSNSWRTDGCFCYSDVNSSTISYDKEEETVTISFPSALPLGNGQLTMDFTGELNDKMKGFYRSKYTGTDGKEKYCAVTQFEVWLFTFSLSLLLWWGFTCSFQENPLFPY